MASSESVRVQKCFLQPELPNLLLATTYALNKSNSKRVTVGLEYHGGIYRPVLKFAGGGSPSKYVTLETNDWDVIGDQMESMTAYLHHSYSFCEIFGNPVTIFLQNNDLHFNQSYGQRAIIIEERLPVTLEKLPRGYETEPLASTSKDDGSSEPLLKKKKNDKNDVSIVMQLPTFEGLKQMRECITNRLRKLTEHAVFVNRCFDNINIILKEKLSREENPKNILKDYKSFKQFYTLNKNDIEISLKNKMEYLGIKENILEIFLIEVNAFYLPLIAKDLYEALCQ